MTSATAPSTLPPALPKARRAPSLWRAGVLIFDLSLARMLWSRGTIFMGLLVGLPVILALLVRGVQAVAAQDMRVEGQVITGPTIFGFMVWWLYLRFIVPVLAVLGTAEDPLGWGTREVDVLSHLPPGGRLVMLDGVGHYPQLEAPDRVVDEYEAFRARVDASLRRGRTT